MVSLTVPDDKKPLYQQPADGVAFFVSGNGSIRNFHFASPDDTKNSV
jgi:hypothetical protein